MWGVLDLIDLKSELQDYHLIDLQAIAERESDIPDGIRNSLILYNKAIESLKSGSEDIAVIELKKAVALNPNFHEAMNLLGLCYTYTQDYEKAAEIFDKVVKAENNSIKAMNYLNQMNSTVENPARKQKARKPSSNINQQTPAPDVQSRSRSQSNPFDRNRLPGVRTMHKRNTGMIIVTGVICFALGLVIMLLINPGNSKDKDLQSEYQTAADAKVSAAEERVAEADSKYEELSQENDKLKNDLNKALDEVDHYKAVIKLNEVENLTAAQKYEEAADILLLMKTSSFTADELSRVEELRKKVMTSAAWTVYESGYKLYNNKKYEEALGKLGKVQVYNPTFERMDAVYYYLGRCSQQLNDSRNALAYFQKLLDNYPKSSYAANAKLKMRAITAQP